MDFVFHEKIISYVDLISVGRFISVIFFTGRVISVIIFAFLGKVDFYY
jgi:hypothetical protein